jgi:predicted PurR-regulated permease PerM
MTTRPTKSSQVSVRTVLTVSLTVLAVVALVDFLLRTQLSLVLTLSAVMLAIALDHAVEVLMRRRFRRPLAIAAVVAGLLFLLVSLGFLLIPPAITQARALAAQAPALWHKAQQTALFVSLDRRFDLHEQIAQVSARATTAITPMLSAVTSVLSVVAALLTLTVLTIFVLIFGPELARGALELLRPDERVRTQRIADKIYRSIGGYIGGLLGICGINAALTGTFLAITRMPFFLPLAIFSGLCSLIPYAGPFVAGSTITIVALVTGGPLKALATGIYFILYGQLEGNVLGPVIYRKTANINPLVTTLSILFLAEFMGLPGAILAVPLAAAGQIILHELVAFRAERDTNASAANDR